MCAKFKHDKRAEPVFSFTTQISTVLGVAVKDQREESAWSEGVAIWVAVIVVSGVGELPPCCVPAYKAEASGKQTHLTRVRCLFRRRHQ